MQLLSVAPASVMHKLEELEQQAAREDSGVLEKATRSTNATAVRNGGQLWKEQAAKEPDLASVFALGPFPTRVTHHGLFVDAAEAGTGRLAHGRTVRGAMARQISTEIVLTDALAPRPCRSAGFDQ
jgi:hypothetical protein